MREIFTSIDIGTDEVKVVTAEYYNEKYNILASAEVKSKGIRQGLIINPNDAASCIKKAIKSVESKLGTRIDKVIAVVPSNNIFITVSEAKIDIDTDLITGSDIYSVMSHSIKGKVESSMEVIDVMPIEYKIDGKKVANPLGLEGEKLELKCVVIAVPKKNVYSVVTTLKALNIEVMDITISSLADYAAAKAKEIDSKVVSLVDIGKEKTAVSIFNKGILIKDTIIPIGSNIIDEAISFSYKIDNEASKKVKEEFAVANRKYADSDEVYEIKNRLEKPITINQYRLSELIENKSIEMLKNIKNEINNLTNKEIGYIIITGGMTSMTGFSAIVEQLFMRNATVMNFSIIGIRNNKYSSCYGAIKYFVEKLELREKEYSMFDEQKISEMLSTRKSFGKDNVLSKIFGKLFD